MQIFFSLKKHFAAIKRSFCYKPDRQKPVQKNAQPSTISLNFQGELDIKKAV